MEPSSFSIAVLISGSGTTLKNLIEKKSQGLLDLEIAHVISSNAEAYGNQFAGQNNLPLTVVDHKAVTEPDFSNRIFDCCRSANVDLVVLGGFLRKLSIPDDFENRVINIHPSLIPSFCGKGFYGIKVHRAVIEFGCKLSGCTVHFVDNEYDHGPIIDQCSVPVEQSDTPEALARRVFEKECELYPAVIRRFAEMNVSVQSRTVIFE